MGLLRGRTARVLAAPGAPLRAIENAVVIAVHLIEPGGCALRRTLLRTLEVLLARYVAGTERCCGSRRGRSFDRGSLRTGSGLTEYGAARKQRQAKQGSNNHLTHGRRTT